ncbi:glycerophosphodiester phosphodiesterase [Saccharopolyspora cebuensis]
MDERVPHNGGVSTRSLEVVAHRGASAERAEHTRGAYELALEQGADGLECDVRVTLDGHLVCVHDRRIDRTSDGRGVVSRRTAESMAALDFTGWFRSSAGLAPPTGPEGVLRLEELLGLVRDHGRAVRLFIETKHPVRYRGLVERELARLLRRYGLAAPPVRDESAVLMMSFSAAAVRRFRAEAPGVPTVLLFEQARGALRRGVLPPWADLAGPGIRVVRRDPGLVPRIAAHGRDTYCWTVDDPRDVALCRDAGVRFVATDAPATTRSHLSGS